MSEPVETNAILPPKRVKERKSRAGWLAAFFALALAAWMGSGYYLPPPEPIEATPRNAETTPFAVQAAPSKAETVRRFVSSEGQVSPARSTAVRAKVGGTVESIEARKGMLLQPGDLIARIALDDRSAQIAEAEADRERAQAAFDRIRSLFERGFSTQADLDDARATLASAEASLAAIRQTAGDTAIRAPIAGVLDRLDLDLGELVAAGAEVGMQIDNNPLTVDIEVAQQSVSRIKIGQEAAVSFITGEERTGTVTYIASNATAATRTFPVEITVQNPDRKIPAGISAQVRIPTDEVPAHLVSAAVLALGSDGSLGIKAVSDEGTVDFHQVELVRAQSDGIWVSGLPDELRIITVGQGFVSQGEAVRVVEGDGETGTEEPDPGETSPLAAASPSSEGASRDLRTGLTDTGTGTGADASPESEKREASTAEAADEDRSEEIARALLPAGSATNLADLSIRDLQQRLQDLGYEPGPVDGVLGEATRNAIRRLQADLGLPVNGEIETVLRETFGRQTGNGDADG